MIKIITDSTCDLPKEIIKEYGIEVLPIEIFIEDKMYKDGLDISIQEIINKMLEKKVIPTTAQIKPFVFEQTYEKFKEDDLIVLTFSSQLSGTFNSALLAKNSMEHTNRRIEVIDSHSVSLGLGMLVLLASKMNKEGCSFDDIVHKIYEKRDNIKGIAIIDTLEYLYRGGRISRSTYAIGNVLNLKIILAVEDGNIKVIDKERGTKKAISFVKKYIKDNNFNTNNLVGFLKGIESEEYVKFENEIRTEFDLRNILQSTLCSTLITHAGPNTCVAFFEQNKN